MAENYFKELYGIDVNDRTYKKKDLTYLGWASAWSELKQVHPDATYEIKKFGEEQIPYIATELGIIVFTTVTVNGITHEMELPVMDGANKSMKKEGYTYTTKFGDKTVEAATMFDVNKTIMRCLTKNIAMHGVALYIYEKDDQPQAIAEMLKLQTTCMTNITKKSALSDSAKESVMKVCKELLIEENGDPRLCEDTEKLETLNKKLLAIRK